MLQSLEVLRNHEGHTREIVKSPISYRLLDPGEQSLQAKGNSGPLLSETAAHNDRTGKDSSDETLINLIAHDSLRDICFTFDVPDDLDVRWIGIANAC